MKIFAWIKLFKGLISMKKYFGFLTIILFLASCSPTTQTPDDNTGPETPTEESTTQPRENDDEVASELTILAENLNIPWAIEQAGETFYISERLGAIVKVEEDETTRQEIKLPEELATVPEAGFLGFTLSPDFEESNKAFTYYTYTSDSGQFNRIVSLNLADDVWSEDEVLLDNIPSGNIHHGGRLLIGPDDRLYATTGDASEPELAQEADSLAGKNLRLNLNGTIPNDNPFEDSYIYTYGHRNAQGMTWLEDGTMYASEHGDQANDEINLIEPGQNYGWPLIEGTKAQENLMTPEFTSGTDTTWAPSGMDAVNNNLYVTGLRGNEILVFDLDTEEEHSVLTEFGRIRDITIEDDFLYFVTNNTDGRGDPEDTDDRLYRIGISELE